jgi:hypothetical protein
MKKEIKVEQSGKFFSILLVCTEANIMDYHVLSSLFETHTEYTTAWQEFLEDSICLPWGYIREVTENSFKIQVTHFSKCDSKVQAELVMKYLETNSL